MPVCASTHLRPPLPTAPLPALVAPYAPADEVPLHRAQRGNYRDHPIELAAHDMNYRPRPRPSGAVALSCLRCRCEPLERRPSRSDQGRSTLVRWPTREVRRSRQPRSTAHWQSLLPMSHLSRPVTRRRPLKLVGTIRLDDGRIACGRPMLVVPQRLDVLKLTRVSRVASRLKRPLIQ